MKFIINHKKYGDKQTFASIDDAEDYYIFNCGMEKTQFEVEWCRNDGVITDQNKTIVGEVIE